MRKRLILITAFLILFIPVLMGIQFPDTYKMVHNATAKVVYIIKYIDILGVECGEKPSVSCVFFEKRRCFTSAHLVKERPEGQLVIETQYQGRTKYFKAFVDYWDRENKIDLIILRIEKDFPYEPVKLAKDYIVGEQVMFGGYGNFPFPKIRFGILNYNPSYGIYVNDIFFGDSGSGIFNLKGELLGINRSIYKLNDTGQITFKGYAVPLETLKEFLNDRDKSIKKEEKN